MYQRALEFSSYADGYQLKIGVILNARLNTFCRISSRCRSKPKRFFHQLCACKHGVTRVMHSRRVCSYFQNKLTCIWHLNTSERHCSHPAWSQRDESPHLAASLWPSTCPNLPVPAFTGWCWGLMVVNGPISCHKGNITFFPLSLECPTWAWVKNK